MRRWLAGSYTPSRRPWRLAARPWSSMPRARDSTAIGSAICISFIRRTSNWAAVPFISTVTGPVASPAWGAIVLCRLLVLHVAAGEDAGHEVQHVRGADLAVSVVADHAVLHHVDLLLRVAIDHRRHQAGQLARVLLVLEQLHLLRLLQPLVGAEVELAPFDRQRADVVHDLAP